LATSVTWGKTKVLLVQGDISDQAVDAVVNAANSSLMGGGGVDGAIHGRGGPEILLECMKIRNTQWPGGLPTGRAVMTTGGKLKAKRVIHTVGPIWSGGRSGEDGALASCYANSLDVAIKHGLKSVAFPSISTGAYGYPIREASRIALKTVKEFAERSEGPAEVNFVLFSLHDLETYNEALREMER